MTVPVTVVDPALDLDSGTYVLNWRNDESARAAMLFYGHVVRRTQPARGQALLDLARSAGGIAAHDGNVDDLVHL